MNLSKQINLDKIQIIIHNFLRLFHFLNIIIFQSILFVFELGKIKEKTLLEEYERYFLVAFYQLGL